MLSFKPSCILSTPETAENDDDEEEEEEEEEDR
jgi:hypothetical protein